jgi:hypothetical protein
MRCIDQLVVVQLAEAVRYEIDGRRTRYRSKHFRETQPFLKRTPNSSIYLRHFNDCCGFAQLSKYALSKGVDEEIGIAR